jgi:hypothetical protein
MIRVFKLFGLFIYFFLSAAVMYFLGDFMLENNNIFLILGSGLLISLIILSIIYLITDKI